MGCQLIQNFNSLKKQIKEIIIENKKHKRLNNKKLSNNNVLIIDNIGPETIYKIKKILLTLSEYEGISFVHKKEKENEKYKNYIKIFQDMEKNYLIIKKSLK